MKFKFKVLQAKSLKKLTDKYTKAEWDHWCCYGGCMVDYFSTFTPTEASRQKIYTQVVYKEVDDE